MTRIDFLRPALVAVLAIPAGFAQDDAASASHARIVEGNPIAVERGRRELAAGDASRLRVDVLVRVLRSKDEFRRAAAGFLLLAHQVAPDEVLAWLREEHDPRVLEPIVELLPVEVLQSIVTTARRFIDSEDVAREDAERDLRDRAFARLVELGQVDGALWRRVINGDDLLLAQFAVQIAAEEVWPFPIPRIDELSPRARMLVLEELGVRPRMDVRGYLDGILAAKGLGVAERLLALSARRSEEWSREDIEALVDSALSEDVDLSHAAEHASWLVAPAVATRLVGEVHRRLLAGADIAAMLDLLRNVDSKGERMLVSLARQLSDEQRDAIVNWLGRRSSPQLDVIVREALDGEYPLTPEILRRTGGLLDSDMRRARVLQFLREPTDAERALLGSSAAEAGARSAGARLSAFDALCEAGVWDEGMLDYALENPDEQPGRIGVLLRLPHDRIPIEGWERLIARTDQRAAGRLITELMRESLPPIVEDALAIRALAGAPAAELAAEACLRVGSKAVAERVWSGLDAERRRAQAASLRLRNDALARGLLMAEPLDGDRGALGYARLAVGDRSILRALVRDPSMWDRPWLGRTGEVVPAVLDQAELDGLVERFDSIDSATQPIVLGWIVARTDLDDHGLAARLFAATESDLESELRPVAMRRILAAADSRTRLRERLDARFTAGLDDIEQDEAYDVVGAAPAPMDAATTLFLARFLLVEPLARIEPELAASLRLAALPHEPRAQLAFQRMVRETTTESTPAFVQAMQDSRAHPAFVFTATSRLERLLEVFVRDDDTRRGVGPVLAQAILDLPDLDRRPLGPAYQMLAERAEADHDFALAAKRWEAAARWYLRAPIAPLAQRVFLGESSSFEGTSSSSWLSSRAPICRVRAALAARDRDAARSALGDAEQRAFGDLRALGEVRALQQEIEK